MALGFDLPSIGVRFKEAENANAAAMGKVASATKARDEALAPLETGIREKQANAPALPKLEAVQGQFQHQGLDNEQMTGAMQTMFAFAALGGMMTRAPMTAAMNGIAAGINGLVKGDEIAFKRGLETYNTNFRTAQAKNQQALQEYTAAAKKHEGDLGSMMNEWKLIAAKHGDTVAAANIEAGNSRSMMQHMENLGKMDEQARRHDQQFQIQMKRMEEFERAARARETIAAEKNAIKDRALQLGGKPTATERQHYMDSNAMIKSIGRVQEMLANPEIRRKIDESRVANYLSDAVETKAIQQFLIRPQIDNDVKNYLTEVANLRNQYYLDMSGKAVTGGEALRNYGAVVQPGDTAGDVLNKMGVASVRAAEKMRDLETYFPSLGVIRQNPPVPAASPAAPANPAATSAPRSFASEAEASAARLTPGTKVIINGQSGTWE